MMKGKGTELEEERSKERRQGKEKGCKEEWEMGWVGQGRKNGSKRREEKGGKYRTRKGTGAE